MWVSGSDGLCLSLPVPWKQPESPELCWLLHSPVELLAPSHRAFSRLCGCKVTACPCWELLTSCHTAAPQRLLCPVLTGVTTQEGHFGPFPKNREAVAGDLEIQMSEGHC